MSSVNDGGPAFPQPLFRQGDGGVTNPSDGWGLGGMSLWEYFAAHAPDSLTAANPALADVCALLGVSEEDYNWTIHWPQAVAILRTRYADAMLARRGIEDPRVQAARRMLYALMNLVAEVLAMNDDDKETRRDFRTLAGAEKAIADGKAAGLKV